MIHQNRTIQVILNKQLNIHHLILYFHHHIVVNILYHLHIFINNLLHFDLLLLMIFIYILLHMFYIQMYYHNLYNYLYILNMLILIRKIHNYMGYSLYNIHPLKLMLHLNMIDIDLLMVLYIYYMIYDMVYIDLYFQNILVDISNLYHHILILGHMNGIHLRSRRIQLSIHIDHYSIHCFNRMVYILLRLCFIYDRYRRR